MKTQPTIRCGAVRTKAFGLAGLAALLAAAVSLPAAEHSRYTITDLGILPGLTEDEFWGGANINNRGHVTVVSYNGSSFFSER